MSRRRLFGGLGVGAFALVLSLMLSVAQTGLSAVGGARRSPVLAGAGRGAAHSTGTSIDQRVTS